jgi:hypothetical protein
MQQIGQWTYNGSRFMDPEDEHTYSPTEVAVVLRIFYSKRSRGDLLPLTEEETERFARVAHPSEARLVRFREFYLSLTSQQVRQLLDENRPDHLRSVD